MSGAGKEGGKDGNRRSGRRQQQAPGGPAAVSRLRARYAETDAMGIVHHASYLVWFEVGRTDLLRELGTPYTAFEAAGLRSPVVEMEVQYRKPARYDDSIRVETRLAEMGPARVRFAYAVYREEDGERLTLLVTGASTHCFLDAAGRPVALRSLPDVLRRPLEAAVQGSH
ncbi:MAG: acyl-CoA thioesterase [Bacillota bacterium]